MDRWTIYYSDTLNALNFMRRKRRTIFLRRSIQQEFNRCIQPRRRYADNYYMQTVNNIRKYKGVRPVPENLGYISVQTVLLKPLNLWKSVKVEYRDTFSGVAHRGVGIRRRTMWALR